MRGRGPRHRRRVSQSQALRGLAGSLSGRPPAPWSNALHARNWLRVAQGGDDAVKVCQIVDLDVEVEGLEAAVAVHQLKVDDVGVLGAENPGHGAERARNVAEDHGQARSAAVRAFAPREVKPVGVDAAGQGVAADDMDFDLLVLAPEADDAVAGDRMTALCEVIGDARSQALDRNRLALPDRARSDVAAGRPRH